MMVPLRHSLTFPDLKQFGPKPFLLFDQKLLKCVKRFSSWAKQFELQYAVTAGEKLKSIESFPSHLQKIVRLTASVSRSELVIVCVGGGSVCDFGGFLASVLKRGVGLIHIPSTWLAAIDAVHGGKTALNVGGIKNQVGTFYPAQKIFIVRELLNTQNEMRAQEAMAELVKIALIDGDTWVKQLFSYDGNSSVPVCSDLVRAVQSLRADKVLRSGTHSPSQLLWHFLNDAIQAKYRIVERDPFETGERQILNFGHTLGHVFESHYNCSHGKAVANGLRFAVLWSKLQFRSFQFREIENLLETYLNNLFQYRIQKIPEKTFRKLLLSDKKSLSDEKVMFVFLKKIGQPMLKPVSMNEIVKEARRQGWVV